MVELFLDLSLDGQGMNFKVVNLFIYLYISGDLPNDQVRQYHQGRA